MRGRTRRLSSCAAPRRVLRMGWLLLSAAGYGGCTVLSDFSAHQCGQDAECELLDGTIRRCDTGKCVPGCSDNHHCATFDSRSPVCPAVGRECIGFTSKDAACYSSSPYDDARMGTLTAAEMAAIGAFAPSLRHSTWLTMQMAATELAAEEGLPAPAVAIICDPRRAADAVEHLNDLGALAIVAALPEAQQRTVVAELAVASPQPVQVSPSAPATEPVAGVWYLGATQEAAVPAFLALISAADQRRRDTPLKIASVTSGTIDDDNLAGLVRTSVTLDDRDAAYLEREGRWSDFTVDGQTLAEDSDVVDAIVGYAPDLVVWFAGGEFPSQPSLSRSALIEVLEQRLPQPPLYLFGPRNVGDAPLRRLALGSASFRTRSVLVRAHRATDPTIRSALDARFRQTYPGADAARDGFGVDPDVYDAIYYATYAVSAVLSGNGLTPTEGLMRVSDNAGPRVDVGPGPSGTGLASELLQQGLPFHLYGTSGPAGFGRTESEQRADTRVMCWAASGDPVEAAVFDPAVASLTSAAAGCAEEFLGAVAD